MPIRIFRVEDIPLLSKVLVDCLIDGKAERRFSVSYDSVCKALDLEWATSIQIAKTLGVDLDNNTTPEVKIIKDYIVGFREWRVSGISNGLPILTSLGVTAQWEPGVNIATCKLPYKTSNDELARRNSEVHGRCASEDCECGFYAFYSMDNLRMPYYHNIIGAVVGWGRTQMHDEGWRSEYARIVALRQPVKPSRFFRKKENRIVENVADRYGVPVLQEDMLVKYSSEFGIVNDLSRKYLGLVGQNNYQDLLD